MMKKIISLFLAFLVFANVLLLSSCQHKELYLDEEYTNMFIHGNPIACMYGDFLFYRELGAASIQYQRLDQLHESPLPLYSDVLAKGEEDPFSDLFGGVFLLVDFSATQQNRGNPILLIAYEHREPFEYNSSKPTRPVYYYRIVSFNTATNKMTIIKDRIQESVQSLDLYENTILYTTNEGDLGYNIHTIQKDGSGYQKMENPEKACRRVASVYNNKIYYTEEGISTKMYSCNLNFSNPEYLFDMVLKTEAFIANGYIYYGSNLQHGELDSHGWTCTDICRRAIDHLEKEETVLQNVSVGMNYGNLFYYCSIQNNRIIDGFGCDEGMNTLYCYDLESGETSIVFDISDQEVYRYGIALSSKYFLFQTSNKDKSGYLSCTNLETGEEIRLPD